MSDTLHRQSRSVLLDALADAVVPVAPADSARERMRDRLLASISPEIRVVRGDEGEWRPFLHGITIKILRRDSTEGTQTALYRLRAGARIPSHRHRREEECLVLEGSVTHAGEKYVAGDYLVAAARSVHEPFESPHGALLMIRGERPPQLGYFQRIAVHFLAR